MRVVTPLEASVAFCGQYLNAWLLSMLREDPRVDPFEEPKGPCFGVGPEELIRSADLTRASDLIPGPVALAILRGVARGSGMRGTSVEKALCLFGAPFAVHERAGEVWLTNGAPLMGAGPTWPVLSLYNLWLGVQAWGDRVRIVGDDLLGVGPKASSQEYDRLLGATGGSVSEAKDTLSHHAGCLVERLCVVESSSLVWYDTVSVGSLTGTSRVEKEAEGLPSFARGPGMKWVPGVDFILEKSFAEEFAQLRRAGLDPLIPREFGGPGFPGSEADVARSLSALRPHWARALRVCMSQGAGGLALLLSLQEPWRMASAGSHPEARSMVAEALSRREQEFGGRDEGSGGRPRGTLEDLRRLIDSRVAPAFGLATGFEVTRQWSRSLTSVANDLRIRLGEINRLVPANRLSTKSRNLKKGLGKFLLKLRSESLVLPADFRASPGIGAARVGY